MNEEQDTSRIGFYGVIIGMIVIVALLVLSVSFVQFGTVRPVTFGGGLTGRLMTEGFNWKAPWQGTETMSMLVQTYEASPTSKTGDANFKDGEVSAQTSDGQQIRISYVVRFKILPSNTISVLRTVGPMDRVAESVVRADSLSWSRKVAQQYTAGALYSGEGVLAYEAEVRETLRASFANLDVTLEDFLVRKIDFAPAYVEAIEKKQIASENVVTQRFNADAAKFERDRQIALAEAEGRRNVILAEAGARQIELLADAQAAAIDIQGEALDRHPAMLRWQMVQQLENVQFAFLPSDGLGFLLPLPSEIPQE